MAPADDLHIEVVYSAVAGETKRVALRLPSGSCVQEALRCAFPELLSETLAVGVWGKMRSLGDVLRDRDRVEVYRALLVDPKEARRQRYQSHRTKVKP
ncbi:MAG: RnfH family protein [Rhizobacter sp.]